MIKTLSGLEIPASWCAVSTIDGTLRMRLLDLTLLEAFPIFSDPGETRTIEYSLDGEQQEIYIGFTCLRQISLDAENCVLIVLAKE